eukprot:PLAT6819.4.p1 GENE.PLAT6819.4~~PLAT6819.4.p1  ORF type:complete len:602 (+),score=182.67 PLAT6819.4:49-1806(+)
MSDDSALAHAFAEAPPGMPESEAMSVAMQRSLEETRHGVRSDALEAFQLARALAESESKEYAAAAAAAAADGGGGADVAVSADGVAVVRAMRDGPAMPAPVDAAGAADGPLAAAGGDDEQDRPAADAVSELDAVAEEELTLWTEAAPDALTTSVAAALIGPGGENARWPQEERKEAPQPIAIDPLEPSSAAAAAAVPLVRPRRRPRNRLPRARRDGRLAPRELTELYGDDMDAVEEVKGEDEAAGIVESAVADDDDVQEEEEEEEHAPLAAAAAAAVADVGAVVGVEAVAVSVDGEGEGEDEEEKRPPPTDALSLMPPELAREIFSFLDGPTLGRCSIICLTWKARSRTGALWKVLCKRSLEKKVYRRVSLWSVLWSMCVASEASVRVCVWGCVRVCVCVCVCPCAGRCLSLSPHVPLTAASQRPNLKEWRSWRALYLRFPRVRLDGMYVVRSTYVRQGIRNMWSDSEWAVLQVVYFRYFVFLPAGRLLYSCVPDLPAKAARALKRGADAASVHKGRYGVDGSTVLVRVRQEEVIVNFEMELYNSKYGVHDRMRVKAHSSHPRGGGEPIPHFVGRDVLAKHMRIP